MSWRVVVISKASKLDLKMSNMVVRQSDNTYRIHLGEIALLMIESTAVSLTTALLSELTERKIKVIFCDNKRNPSSELVPFYGSHDSSAKIKRQINWNDDFKELLWTEIVREKISKQRRLLLKEGHSEEADMLLSYMENLELNDETNREGHAAKVYFNALFGMDFTRGADIAINAALNYGYSLFASAISREIVANGYLTQIGLFHDNQFNHYNLTYDLLEPFRIIVDEKVVEMSPLEFGKEEKLELVNLLNKQVYINQRKQYMLNAIKIYCKGIFNALDQEDMSCLRFYRNEL